jgi:hypothetical protein
LTDEKRPDDEREALEALERLRQDIQMFRRRRERAAAEFDAFVTSFRQPAAANAESRSHGSAHPSDARPAEAGSTASERVTTLAEAGPPSIEDLDASNIDASHVPSVVGEPVSISDPASGSQPTAAVSSSSRRRWKLAFIAAIGIVAALVMARFWRDTTPEPALEEPAAATERTGAATARSTPPATRSADAVKPRPLRIELATSRPVWVRAVVDDERVFERELAADQRIPLEADHAIVIRAGDGGAVRVKVNGTDTGILGMDGQVVTRTFSPPSPASGQLIR